MSDSPIAVLVDLDANVATVEPGTEADAAVTIQGSSSGVPVRATITNVTIPVTDAGGSLTVDGAVTVTNTVQVESDQLPELGQQAAAQSLSVVLASDHDPIAVTGSLSVEMDTTGLATETTLAAIRTALQGTLTVDGSDSTQPISGSVEIDGTVATRALTSADVVTVANPVTSVSVSNLPSVQPVSDNAGSLTVDTPQLPAALVGGKLDVAATIQGTPTVTANLGTTAGLALDSSITSLANKFGALGQKAMSGSSPVTIASDQSPIPVTGSIAVDTSDLATEATLQSIDTKLDGPLEVTGTITATVDTSGLATETTLASVNSKLGGTLAVDGSGHTQPVSAVALPLPAGAATDATLATRLTESTFTARTPTVGQKVSASSSPVVLASDQSTLPISGSVAVSNFPASQPVSGTVAVSNAFVLDATATGGTAKSIARGGSKGATAAADVTSTAEGTDHQALDVQLYHAGATVNPTQIRALASGTDSVTTVPSGTQSVSGTVTANIGTSGSLALDATLTGGTQKAINRGAAKGTTTAADVTSTAEGTNNQALDVQLYHGGSAINPTAIRALTSADTVTIVPSGTQTVSGSVSITGTPNVAVTSSVLPSGAATSAKQPAIGAAGTASTDVLTIQGITSMTPIKIDGSSSTQPVSGTVTVSNAFALDSTITGGTQKAIARGGAKGTSTAADVTSTAEGANNQALDVQLYHGGSAINPTVIRALTSADTVTIVPSGTQTVSGSVSITTTDTSVTGTLGALNDTLLISAAGKQSVGYRISTNNLIATVVAETNIDGTNYNFASHFYDGMTAAVTTSIVFSGGSTVQYGQIRIAPGSSLLRIRVSGYTSGTAGSTLRASDHTGVTEINTGAWLGSTAPTVGSKTSANSIPVVVASDQGAVPITVAALPLPTGSATETTLAAVSGKLPATLGAKVSAASLGVVLASDQAVLPVSGTVAVSNSFALDATLTGGSQRTKLTDGTTNAAVKAASTAAVAADPALVVAVSPNNTVAVSMASSPLASGAATETTLASRLADATFTARVNTQGQKTSSASTPVVLASDQSSIPVAATIQGTPAVTLASTTITGTVAVSSATLALDATLTGGSQQSQIKSGTKGTSTAALVTSTAEGTNNQALDVQIYHGAAAINPTAIRALTSSDQITTVPSGTQTVSGSVSITGTPNVAVTSSTLPTGASTAAKQPAIGAAGTASSDVLSIQGITGMVPIKIDGSSSTQPVSGTVTVSNSFALDSTLTGGSQKAIARGAAKGATTAADVTSTAEGANNQALDVQLYHGGAAINPTAIRALTSSDVVTSTQGTAAALSAAWPVKFTDGTNTMPTADTAARSSFGRVTDGTNTAAVKAASTAAAATDPALVVAISPNNTLTVSNSFALDATLTGGSAKFIARGGAKGTSTAADVTSTAEGTNNQALDVQIYHGGVAKDPTQIRALTSSDQITTVPSGTQTVTGSVSISGTPNVAVTSSALPTGASTESTLSSLSSKFPSTLGAKTSANSLGVVLASDQAALSASISNFPSTQPVSAASLPLPSGASTEATLASLSAKFSVLGSKTSANSAPVVIASDQGAVPVSGTITANIGTSALALDATLTGGTAKTITRTGAKGTSVAADVTSTAAGSNHQALDVAIVDASGNQVTSFGTAASIIATTSSVAGSTSSVALVASNVSRKGATIYNESTANLFVKMGATASTTSYTCKLAPESYWECPYAFVGQIDGVWSSATGAARVTELT